MKLCCNVTRDLLPLYLDGVCSDESRALVEAHLDECAGCGAILKELRGEIEVPHESPDDQAVLKKLGKNVKRAWLRGAAAVLAVVLVVWIGTLWHNNRASERSRAMYLRFTEGQEPFGDDRYPYDYEWIHGNYMFRVTLPEEGSSYGAIEVREFKWTKDLRNPADLEEFSLRIDFTEDGGYLYHVSLESDVMTDSGEMTEMDWIYECVTLTTEGVTVYDDGLDGETIARKDAFVETYRTEIVNIITAAEREWPFLTS
ncbi:MAG: zf-HC2 domain-containing protein [Oscillospiraceae bacterium]|nr:zf-HC2 domain-containing protein [Oscillospiraceae bacterium]